MYLIGYIGTSAEVSRVQSVHVAAQIHLEAGQSNLCHDVVIMVSVTTCEYHLAVLAETI